MASVNKKTKLDLRTHEGAKAHPINAEMQLRRSVLACLLWEDTFYEDGVSIADRISNLVKEVDKDKVMALAEEARKKFNLRHVPLLLLREATRHGAPIANALASTISRVDELTEFVSIYWKDGKQPLSAQSKKGLAKAFTKFNEYQLAKYNRDKDVKLRDVLFLSHAKGKDQEQQDIFNRLVDNKLATPNTWEVNLSAGKDKKTVWETMLSEGTLGGLALLRNLRNMRQVKVNEDLIKNSLAEMNVSRILPFRFVNAAINAPDFEEYIEVPFLRCARERYTLPGKTIVVVDVSGSMYGGSISKNSTMDRARVACTLAAIAREACEKPVIYATAGNDATRIHKTKKVPARRGFALVDAIYDLCHPLGGGGIFLKPVIDFVREEEETADRIIVITDEQDCAVADRDRPTLATPFGKHNYLINVATYQNGIGYGKWTHIDGFSEAVFDYINEYEKQQF